MTYFASCFLVAMLATLFTMRSATRHGHLSADHDLSGPQKFHARPVPRLGNRFFALIMPALTVVWLALSLLPPSSVAREIVDNGRLLKTASDSISAGIKSQLACLKGQVRMNLDLDCGNN